MCNALSSLQAGLGEVWLHRAFEPQQGSHRRRRANRWGGGEWGPGKCSAQIGIVSPGGMLTMQGAGGFGSVYAARWRDKDVAVKRLSPSIGQDSEQYKALVREVELSSKFNSERLVRVYGACLKVGALVLSELHACVSLRCLCCWYTTAAAAVRNITRPCYIFCVQNFLCCLYTYLAHHAQLITLGSSCTAHHARLITLGSSRSAHHAQLIKLGSSRSAHHARLIMLSSSCSAHHGYILGRARTQVWVPEDETKGPSLGCTLAKLANCSGSSAAGRDMANVL